MPVTDKKIIAELNKVSKEFFRIENIIEYEEIEGGFINRTYEVRFPKAHYVIQQINDYVFKSPFSVMNNINLISEHLKEKCIYEGRSAQNSCLTFIKTRFNQTVAIVDGKYWRCMEFLDDSITLLKVKQGKVFYEMGKAVGDFHFLLDDFHTRLIDETIPHFHDTPYRYERFLEAIRENEGKERTLEVEKEIKFVIDRKDKMNIIIDLLANKTIPYRACHNDTKCSNVMFDKESLEYMCLIDLDTTMKGAIAYDFGDALRQGASTANEDETDLSKVDVDIELARNFTRGFLEGLRPRGGKQYISKEEIKSLYYGYLVITLEAGMRFLKDYIQGDIYFRINPGRPKHNLERARAQLKLVKIIEDKKKIFLDDLNLILKELDGYEPIDLI